MPERTTNLRRSTHIYKTVGSLAVEADVYTAGTRRAPKIVWLHGGALIFGRRDTPPEWLLDLCRQDGFELISVDYRLAPETKLPEIVADIQDAFDWVQKRPNSAERSQQPPIAAVGESAGGYLALTAGYRVSPTPSAIVSLWGYGQLTGSWYREPSHHPVHNQVQITFEDAQREVSGPPIADERRRQGNGHVFYQACRQHGIWPSAISGWDPKEEASKFAPFTPLLNVSGAYPPTMLIHGTADTDVPYGESLLMADVLGASDVEHRLVTVEDAEHGLFGADAVVAASAFQQAADFLRSHLQ
jgi:acetyl esterase/lipase